MHVFAWGRSFECNGGFLSRHVFRQNDVTGDQLPSASQVTESSVALPLGFESFSQVYVHFFVNVWPLGQSESNKWICDVNYKQCKQRIQRPQLQSSSYIFLKEEKQNLKWNESLCPIYLLICAFSIFGRPQSTSVHFGVLPLTSHFPPRQMISNGVSGLKPSLHSTVHFSPSTPPFLHLPLICITFFIISFGHLGNLQSYSWHFCVLGLKSCEPEWKTLCKNNEISFKV